ncbi:MAG: isoprenylcysteine carboxylmethyltransferase family protein [Anaerolineales bacterium]|nr:isoprenylcysteine carboxylmethyltransferase family protein [Anaerolineales bacterium]WKZ39580.1 MAG: isoprenylcysteine carboxylmethyltransferase family protein [Anaerolineales bacterium]
MSIFVIILALAVWGVVHSVTASHFFKDMVRGMVGAGGMRLYRIGYNVFSVVSFAPILYLAWTLPNQLLYDVPAPWRYVMMGGQAVSLLLLFAAFLQTDALSFVGLSQLFGAGEQAPGQLVTRGLYRVVRHPLYTFSMAFLWLSPSVSQNSFALYLGVTLYFVIGAYFEERKLLRDFGDAYAEYKRRTPMLIPVRLLPKK